MRAGITTQALIKGLREHYGLTQKQLAEKFGISQSRISNFENGKCNLSIDKFSTYCSRAGVRIDINLELVEITD